MRESSKKRTNYSQKNYRKYRYSQLENDVYFPLDDSQDYKIDNKNYLKDISNKSKDENEDTSKNKNKDHIVGETNKNSAVILSWRELFYPLVIIIIIASLISKKIKKSNINVDTDTSKYRPMSIPEILLVVFILSSFAYLIVNTSFSGYNMHILVKILYGLIICVLLYWPFLCTLIKYGWPQIKSQEI